MSDDALEFKIRNEIFNFILKNPGMHIAQICENLEIPRSTLVYHLKFLTKKNILNTENDGKYTRYYLTKSFGKDEHNIMLVLRKKPLFDIILVFMHCGIASQKEISQQLDKKPSTISSHINILKENGVIEEVHKENQSVFKTKTEKEIIRNVKNREIIYRLKDPEKIYFTILKNKKSFLKDQRSNLIFGNITYYMKDGVPKRRKHSNREVDRVEKKLYEVFPHPYHV